MGRDFKADWTRVSFKLKEILQPDIWSRWIDVIDPVSFEGGVVTLGVDNDFYQTWLEENYVPMIRDALGSVLGEVPSIAFKVAERLTSNVKAEQKEVVMPALTDSKVQKNSRRYGSFGVLNPNFTFDRFVSAPCNDFAFGAAIAVAEEPGKKYNPLFIYGGVGLGKTHLAQAIAHEILEKQHGKVVYVSTETFVNDYIAALTTRSLVDFRKRYRGVDVLLIDDVQFLGNKERMQEEFFHTFNGLFDARKQIVMTSDKSPGEIFGLEERLVSRFEWGIVAEVENPDLETRQALLRKWIQDQGYSVEGEVLDYIAEHVQSNIRRLEGALVRVASYSSLVRRSLTLDMAKDLLKDVILGEKSVGLSLDGITSVVANYYGFTPEQLRRKGRQSKTITDASHVAEALCYKLLDVSQPEVACYFGKTHATIHHALNRIRSAGEGADARLYEGAQEIARKLGKDYK